MKPMSDKRAAEMVEYRKEKKAWLESQPVCERCGCVFADEIMLTPVEPDLHHKRGRTGRLLRDQRFWIALCRDCHDWVHNNMAEARNMDLLCELGEWNTYPDV